MDKILAHSSLTSGHLRTQASGQYIFGKNIWYLYEYYINKILKINDKKLMIV